MCQLTDNIHILYNNHTDYITDNAERIELPTNI